LRGHVDKGVREIISHSFKINLNDPSIEPLCEKFLDHYLEKMCQYTEYFLGVDNVLNYLHENNIPWGIVTNRPHFLVQPIIKKFNFDTYPVCMVYGDTLSEAKPSPAPLSHASQTLKLPANNIAYVGDTVNDMIAANAAGMQTVFANYGYLRQGSNLTTCKIQYTINQADELIAWLQKAAVA